MFAIKRSVRTLAAASFAIALAAAPAVAQESAERDASDKTINVTVENRNFNDVRIYAVTGIRSWRLGNVFGFNSETFEVPRFLTSSNTAIRIVAYPIGTASVVSSQEVLVQPGDEIVYRVESYLPLSNVMVLPGL